MRAYLKALLVTSLIMNIILMVILYNNKLLNSNNLHDKKTVQAAIGVLKQQSDRDWKEFDNNSNALIFDGKNARCVILTLKSDDLIENRDRLICFDQRTGKFIGNIL